MGLRPVVIVGCGGSGGKVVQMLRAGLMARLRRLGWEEDFPAAWQLVIVDSPKGQEAQVPGVPPVDQNSYFSLSRNLHSYTDVTAELGRRVKPDAFGRLHGWLPEPPISVSLEVGAGRMRAVGRAMSVAKFYELGNWLDGAVKRSQGGISALNTLGRKLEVNDTTPEGTTPATYVVSSMAGGTGAGVFIDVCDLLRTKVPNLNMGLSAILFTAEVFRDLPNNDGLQPNTLAALSELMSGYFDQSRRLEPLYEAFGLPAGSAVAASSGPSQTYVVGMSALNSEPLGSVMDCYRAVSESLTTAIWDPAVSDRFMQYSTGNWLQNQQANLVDWEFGNASDLKGVVSSFGSAQLSIGLNRFEEYAACRLSRAIIDFQREDWAEVWRRRMEGQGSRREHLTHEDIVEFVRQTQGIGFVDRCGLNELDIDGTPHDQIQDAVTPTDELSTKWKAWQHELIENELRPKASMASRDWLTTIEQVIPARQGRFLKEVEARIDEGSAVFVDETVPRITATVSQSMSEFGIRPTVGLLRYLDEQLAEAAKQLDQQAGGFRLNQQDWQTRTGNAFAKAPRRMKFDDPNCGTIIEQAVREATGPAFWEARILRATRSRELIVELRNQVVSSLIGTLQQMAEDIGVPTSGEKEDRAAQWPGSTGVPPAFTPPPFEACLLDFNDWPRQLEELMNKSGDTIERMRAEVGGGGFSYSVGATEREEALALTVRLGTPWSPTCLGGGSGIPVEFEHHMSPDDVLSRAYTWINRDTTALGDFLKQGLAAYLDPMHGGKPVADHRRRLDRFEVALKKTLASTAPLINVNTSQLSAVHPSKGHELLNLDYIPQKLPILKDTPARPIAEEVFKEFLQRDGSAPTDDAVADFFTDTPSGSESVTYMSRLASAIHPAAITSVTEPIVGRWNQVASPETFWDKRRSRTLPEFIPVPPRVLNAMIKGFFNARILGLFPDPSAAEGRDYFTIYDESMKHLKFPWPLLAGKVPRDQSFQVSWLAWILESLPLAMVQFPLERHSLDAFDRLFKLGAAPEGAIVGFDDLPSELMQAIQFGSDTHHPRVKLSGGGSTPEAIADRKDQCLTYLKQVQDAFGAASPPGDAGMDKMWTHAPGYELFDRISEVLARQLVPALQNFNPVDGGVL